MSTPSRLPGRIAIGVGMVVLALLASLAGSAAARPEADARAACGVELWSLKTLSDPQRQLVRLHPRRTLIAAINGRPMPRRTPTHRSTSYERQVWQVVAQITVFRLDDDQDIHLVLFDAHHGGYMIAEMPAPSCLPRTTRDRRAIVRARLNFIRQCGQPTDSWQSLGAVVRISGVGFWDFARGQRGHARNYAELHPVTGIHILAGCGS